MLELLNALPVHESLRHPRTGLPLQAIGLRRNGEPIWPVMGASSDDPSNSEDGKGGDGKPAGDGKPEDGKGGDGKGGDGKPADLGYPPDTPLAQMTTEQQLAYWKHHSQKHEKAWQDKSLVGLTVDEAKALREKAEQFDALHASTKTETEKRIEAARAEGAAEARREAQPAIVRAKFEAMAGPALSGEQLSALLEPVDLLKFVKADGSLDTDKMSAFLAPATQGQPRQLGAPNWAQGGRGGTGTTPSVASGQEAYHQRKNKNNKTT